MFKKQDIQLKRQNYLENVRSFQENYHQQLWNAGLMITTTSYGISAQASLSCPQASLSCPQTLADVISVCQVSAHN